MRLIDAEKLKQSVTNEMLKAELNSPVYCTLECVVADIEEQPTAYDVDKVIEQLNCESCADCLLMENCSANFGDGFMEKIREIIKEGGVNQLNQ